MHEVITQSSTDSRHCSPLSITNLVSKVWVQGKPILGEGYDRGDKVSPGNAAVALVGHPQALQLQRHCNGQATIHSSVRIACNPNAEWVAQDHIKCHSSGAFMAMHQKGCNTALVEDAGPAQWLMLL